MKSNSITALTDEAIDSLKIMGKNIRLARKLRGESINAFSERCFISAPTLGKIEKGDPTVSIGAIASVLSVIEDEKSLSNLASHERDVLGQGMANKIYIKKSKGLDNDF